MRISVQLSAIVIVAMSMISAPAAFAGGYTSTKYPIVLVHGFMGFNEISGVDYFYRIPDNLKVGGASVYVVKLSALNSNEERGEQLVNQVEEIIALSGASKVNLIAHSQGGLAARYASSVTPGSIASVTTIGTPNEATGFPLGEWVGQAHPPGSAQGNLIAAVVTALAQLVDSYSGMPYQPQDYAAFLSSMSVASLNRFNADHPQALPASYCQQGDHSVGGIRYYSWSGAKVVTNLFDLSDYALAIASGVTGTDSDGLVTRCGSHLGLVIRDNYSMNHLDEINHLFGFYGLFSTSPVVTYRTHANRLKNSGL
ncbi:esterase/lipase family protein [Alkalimarinus coralli]|uniref:esterase/lipase family protein n=1 Tax=Alkalimarinus coralli TaxID=2935863 RepID=UPI00202B49E4|nr:triacylglycerol lipase [Alkalimarinus coralli]